MAYSDDPRFRDTTETIMRNRESNLLRDLELIARGRLQVAKRVQELLQSRQPESALEFVNKLVENKGQIGTE